MWRKDDNGTRDEGGRVEKGEAYREIVRDEKGRSKEVAEGRERGLRG